MKKVLRIVPELDFGGVERRILLTHDGFNDNRSIKLYTLVLGKGGRISDKIENKYGAVQILNRKYKIPNFSLIFNVYSCLIKVKPDVVHTSAAEANFHGLIAAFFARVPIRIGEEIGFPNHDWKWKLVFKWVYKSANKVIAISQAVKERIVELGEVEIGKVEVVYNPVGLENREKEKGKYGKIFKDIGKGETAQYVRGEGNKNHFEGETRFVFVTTCRLVPVKNLDTLIKVFAELVWRNRDRDLKLWLVGDGPERGNLEFLVKDLRIKENVVFLGFQEEVAPFLERADAFVLPSLSEGFSISLVEAMLCGLPCIVTNKGGPSEIMNSSDIGFLINPEESQELKSCMARMIQMTKDDRIKMGKKAQKRAELFSVKNYVNRLQKIYNFRQN